MAPVRIAVIGGGHDRHERTSTCFARAIRTTRSPAIADPAPIGRRGSRASSATRSTRLSRRCSTRRSPTASSSRCRTSFTSKVGLACVARKIPVIIEKPIADSIAAALRARRGRRQGRACRSWPAIIAATTRSCARPPRSSRGGGDRPRRGGERRSGSATSRTTISTSTWRREPGGGPVLINAIHDIDCLRMLCGDIESVQAATANGVAQLRGRGYGRRGAALQERRARHADGLRYRVVALDLGMGSRENPTGRTNRELLHRRRHAGFARRAVAGTSLA